MTAGVYMQNDRHEMKEHASVECDTNHEYNATSHWQHIGTQQQGYVQKGTPNWMEEEVMQKTNIIHSTKQTM